MDQTITTPSPAQELSTLRLYWRVAVRPYRPQALSILVLMLVGAAMDVAVVGLTVPLLDALTDQGRAARNHVVMAAATVLRGAGIDPSMGHVVFTLLVVASLLFVTRSVVSLWSHYRTVAIAVNLRRTIKVVLFEKFLHAQYEEVSKRARGAVANDINTPAEAFCGAIVNLSSFFTGMFNSLLMIALLFYLSWWCTLLIGVLAVGGVLGWRRFADRRSAAHGRTLYRLHGEQNKLQVDAIDGLKVVKSHGLEPWILQRQDGLSAAEWYPELRFMLLRDAPAVVHEVIAATIVLGLGVATFLFPSLGIRFSMLAAFLVAIRRIAPAIASMTKASVTLNREKRNFEVFEEVVHAMPQESRGGQPVGRVEEVQLDSVEFSYASRPTTTVLNRVSLSMRTGTVTAVVGSTGSGKSTIANLLVGLYEPRAGSIRINGVDLRRLDLAAWRRRVGYVCQDVFVFNASIRENLALGDDALPPAQIEWAARVAQLHEFILSLPDGYDTVVGDRGLRLSGGQCQRLAIARAIMRRPEALIFDEATSALDNLTERAVYDAISALRQDAVVIVIAHRLSTVRDADQIIVMQAGEMVERGTHESLMQQQGVYASLYTEAEYAASPGRAIA